MKYTLENFAERAREGWSWESKVAEALRAFGLPVEHGELKIRAKEEGIAEYTRSQKDLTVCGLSVEVKSRKLAFTEERYPYSTAFLETVEGFKKKTTPPDYYVLVSQETGCMLWTPADPSGWTVRTSRDRSRGTVEHLYEVQAKKLRPLVELVSILSEKVVRSRNGISCG